MPIIYVEGALSAKRIKAVCDQHGLSPKKTVFLFPGNNTHHQESTLFSLKTGGGLANTAAEHGTLGGPTLSLPTTNFSVYDGVLDFEDVDTKALVENAIADIYRAHGAGFDFILPVRPHESSEYFTKGFDNNPSLEPSFWKGIQRTSNLLLADHYMAALDQFNAFTALSPADQLQLAQSDPGNPYYQAYLKGLNHGNDDPWLSSNDMALFQRFQKTIDDNQSLLFAIKTAGPQNNEDVTVFNDRLQYFQQLLNFSQEIYNDALLCIEPISQKMATNQKLTAEEHQKQKFLLEIIFSCNTLLQNPSLQNARNLEIWGEKLAMSESENWEKLSQSLIGLAVVATVGILAITPIGGTSVAVFLGAVVFEKAAIVTASFAILAAAAFISSIGSCFAYYHALQPMDGVAKSAMDAAQHYDGPSSRFFTAARQLAQPVAINQSKMEPKTSFDPKPS